jgi:hypothetical protein
VSSTAPRYGKVVRSQKDLRPWMGQLFQDQALCSMSTPRAHCSFSLSPTVTLGKGTNLKSFILTKLQRKATRWEWAPPPASRTHSDSEYPCMSRQNQHNKQVSQSNCTKHAVMKVENTETNMAQYISQLLANDAT